MGSRQRSIAARNGLVLLFVLFAAGCANSSVQVSSGSSPTAGASGSSVFGALMLIGFMVSSEEDYRNGFRVRANPFDGFAPAPLPPLDPERRVQEVDCTKPIEDWSANLKCR